MNPAWMFAAALFPVSVASAVTYTSQTRTVSASLNNGGTSVSASAPDFAPWDQTIASTPSQFGGSASASQQSTLGPLGVTIHSTLNTLRPTNVGTGFADAKSSLSVSFTVPYATTFHLSGTLPPGPNFPPPYPGRTRRVTLSGPGTNIDLNGSWVGNTPPTLTGTGSFDFTGNFAPGNYSFLIAGESADGGPANSAENLAGFDAALSIAAPRGDFNANGDLDATDIDALLAATPGPTSAATLKFDLNSDGSVMPAPNAPASDADVWVKSLVGTRYGDANLDRRVDFTDLVTLAQHYHATSGGWAAGNFDGANGVNFTDLVLLAQSYNFGTEIGIAGDSSGFASDFSSDWAVAQSLVPEPALTCGTVAVWITCQRRRSQAARSPAAS